MAEEATRGAPSPWVLRPGTAARCCGATAAVAANGLPLRGRRQRRGGTELPNTAGPRGTAIVIGGGMVLTFVKARGLSVGGSLVEEDMLHLVEKLPSDVACGDDFPVDGKEVGFKVKSSSKSDIADAGRGDGAEELVEGRDRGRRCWETELEKVKLNRHA